MIREFQSGVTVPVFPFYVLYSGLRIPSRCKRTFVGVAEGSCISILKKKSLKCQRMVRTLKKMAAQSANATARLALRPSKLVSKGAVSAEDFDVDTTCLVAKVSGTEVKKTEFKLKTSVSFLFFFLFPTSKWFHRSFGLFIFYLWAFVQR